MNKILVTGGKGLLATEIKKQITTQNVMFCDIEDMDITDINSIKNYFSINKGIKTIINCAAGRDAELLEEDPTGAEKIGVSGPKNLATIANDIGANLIHISSDYVFDGKKSSPYVEADATNALSVYGYTKAIGEQEILKTANTAIILRTAWLLSLEGKKSFLNTIINLAQTKKDLGIVFDQVGSPTVASDLAKMILEIVPQIKKGTKEIYHLTNEGIASWYDIAYRIVQELKINCHIRPILSSQYPTKAKRPTYSVLDKEKIKKDFNLSIRHYSEGLLECLKQVNL